METMLTALAVTFIAVLAVPLAVVAIGIHRQHRAGSLTARPPGVTASLTRRILGLRAGPPAATRSRPATRKQAAAPDPARRNPNRQAALAAEAQR